MKRHLQVVDGIVIQNGAVLAARRGESKYAYVAHKYEFAGGKIEAGETPPQALAREFAEELRAKIEVGERFMRLTHEYPDFIVTLDTYFCTLLTPVSRTEHEELRFIPLAELSPADWAPADAPAVKALRAMAEGEEL